MKKNRRFCMYIPSNGINLGDKNPQLAHILVSRKKREN